MASRATSAPRLGSPCPHMRRDWANPCHMWTWTGPTPATSAPRLGPPHPHLHRDWAHPLPHVDQDWAHPCHIRTGARPHRHATHICTVTGRGLATSALGLGPPLATCGTGALGLGPPLATCGPGLGPPLPHPHRGPATPPRHPHLHCDWARSRNLCTGTGPTPAKSAPGLGSALQLLHWGWARPCRIRAGTRLTLPHLRRDCARPLPVSAPLKTQLLVRVCVSPLVAGAGPHPPGSPAYPLAFTSVARAGGRGPRSGAAFPRPSGVPPGRGPHLSTLLSTRGLL
jgi:hypothetical protein